jgi:transposase InsO family protein
VKGKAKEEENHLNAPGTRRPITKPIETLEQLPKSLQDSHKGQIRIFQVLMSQRTKKIGRVKALVDTGATTSFISEKLFRKLQLNQPRFKLQKSRPFKVQTANGELTFPGQYVKLYIRQNDNSYNWQYIKFYIDSTDQLPIINMILGITDLKLLGIHLATIFNDQIIYKNEGKVFVADVVKELQDRNNVGYDFPQYHQRRTLSTCHNDHSDPEVTSLLDVKCQIFKAETSKPKRQSMEKRDIHDFNFHPKTPEKVQDDIKDKVLDLYQRKGYKIASNVKDILLKYYNQIAATKYDIGTIPGVEFKIVLRPDSKAVRQKPIRFHNPKLVKELKANIDELLAAGVLEKVDQSDWQTQVFIVVNHDGTTRMVTNYKDLNNASLDEAYPVATVPEMMSQFAGKTVFSKFDICKAFMNVAVEPRTQKLLTITTPWGCYKYTKMPFGHKNCPATWSRAADLVFQHLTDLVYYVDDFVVNSADDEKYSATENHLKAIEEFFKRLAKYKIKVKLSKCAFFVDEFKWLGKIVSAKGIKPDDEYIKKILEYRRPTNLHEYRRWLGLLEWISNHVYCLKEVMHPLRDLPKQTGKFRWEPKFERAFQKIKEIIQHTEIVQHPDFTKPFIVHVDASNNAYGAILFQTAGSFTKEALLSKAKTQFYIVDMFSRFWSDSQENMHITSKELLALIHAVNKWSSFISTNKFYISTDSSNIPYLLRLNEDKVQLNSAHQRWATYLLGLNFEVRHIKGVENKVADFLSRLSKPDIQHIYQEGRMKMCHLEDDLQTIADRYHPSDSFEPVENLLQGRPIRKTRNPHPRYADNGMKIHPKHYDEKSNAPSATPLSKRRPERGSGKIQGSEETKRSEKIKQSEKIEHRSGKPDQNDANYERDLADYQDEIIEKIEDLQSDHLSSENSFRDDDLARNNTVLQDPILTKQLLESWSHDPDIFDLTVIARNQRCDPLIQVIKDVMNNKEVAEELPPKLSAMVGNKQVRIRKDIVEIRLSNDKQWRIYAPAQHKLALLRYFHEAPLSMHTGVMATENAIRQYFYWPNLNKDIREYIAQCQVCQQAKGIKEAIDTTYSSARPKGLNQVIAIDHKGPLPRTKSGNRYIMNVMDLFSGYVESIPLPRIGACTTAWNILSKWIFRFGIPDAILTDQGSDFTSEIVTKLCEFLGMKKKFSSAYTPQSNGQIERFHRSLSQSLKIICNDRKISFNEANAPWDLYLPFVTAKHNNQYSRIIKMAPNELIYGHKIRLPHDQQLARFQNVEHMPHRLRGWLRNIIKLNGETAIKNLAKFHENELRKQSPKKIEQLRLGEVVVVREGPNFNMGNDVYDAKKYSGSYIIVKVYPSGKAFDLQKVGNPKQIRKQVNYRHILRFRTRKRSVTKVTKKRFEIDSRKSK